MDRERDNRSQHGVSRESRVWFTLGHGILNEVYSPRVDHACTRDSQQRTQV